MKVTFRYTTGRRGRNTAVVIMADGEWLGLIEQKFCCDVWEIKPLPNKGDRLERRLRDLVKRRKGKRVTNADVFESDSRVELRFRAMDALGGRECNPVTGKACGPQTEGTSTGVQPDTAVPLTELDRYLQP